jgi:ubiquinone/menaquinone biosynthesis C-methylase UbiE
MLTYEFLDPEQQIASEDFQFIESFLKATRRTQLGWHYITDITWIYSKIKHWPRSWKILDAGGGSGPVQFLMAELGFNVTNIDMALSEPPLAYCDRYQTSFRTLPSFVPTGYIDLLTSPFSLLKQLKQWVKRSNPYQVWNREKYVSAHDAWRSKMNLLNQPIGQIHWLVGNLCNIPEMPANYFDAIVSLSALEHIPLELLHSAVLEIRRVLKRDAKWAVTTSGTHVSSTWLHKPSQGYCFSVSDLESFFGAVSAYQQKPAQVLDQYIECNYLKDNLAEFYKKSGQYGMPWGKWDPKYIPVGLA